MVTTVARIVDGDTLYLADLDVRMRLIGIDTPETRHPDRGVECFGHAATAHLSHLVPPGTEVWVEWDVERHDRYGRPLGYLYRADDGLFVNLQMVLDGYASSFTVPPNVAHQEVFVAAQRDAREAGRGLWAACDEHEDGDDGGAAGTEDDATGPSGGTATPVSITTIRYDGPGDDVEYGDSEYVELANGADRAIDVSGWSVSDEAGHRITLPSGYRIPAGDILRIHTGPGDDGDADYYAGEDQAIWNNSGGDTATLRDADGLVADTHSYDS